MIAPRRNGCEPGHSVSRDVTSRPTPRRFSSSLGEGRSSLAPAQRRCGRGSEIVRALLACTSASAAYLQVEQSNTAAVSMYERLGFSEAYRYCHRTEPG